MYRLTCKAFTVEASTLTEVVEKWNRAKHSAAHSCSEIQIESIELIADGYSKSQSEFSIDDHGVIVIDRCIKFVQHAATVTQQAGLDKIFGWFENLWKDLRYIKSRIKVKQ